MGARLIRDLNPEGSSSPESIISIDGLLYFTANLGTPLLSEPKLDEETSDQGQGTNNEGNTDSIQENSPGQGIALLKSDGTSGGTQVLKEFQSVSNLIEVDDDIYFIAGTPDGYQLWKSDGTTGGTEQIKNIYPSADQNFAQDLFEIDGVLYFSANDSLDGKYPEDNGYELWRWEGDGIGTRFFRNLIPDVVITDIDIKVDEETDIETATITTEIFENDSFPRDFTGLNGNFFFTAYSTSLYTLENRTADIKIGGLELWFSDGTESGTRPLNINQKEYTIYDPEDGEYSPASVVSQPEFGYYTDSSSSFPRELTTFDNSLYFVANDGIHGFELWSVSDHGTNQTLIDDLRPGNTSSSPEELTVVNGNLYFTADNGSGRQLYAYNKSLQKPQSIVASGQNPKHLTDIGGTLYYSAKSELGRELWRVDGDQAEFVMDINPGTNSSSPNQFNLIERIVKNKKQSFLYFTADDGKRGFELWSLDLASKSAIPQRVSDIYSGPSSSDPRKLTNSDERLFFSADDGKKGRELWTLGPAIQGPIANADSGTSNIQVHENKTNVFLFTTEDDTQVRWSLNGGIDSDIFKIKKKTGHLIFKTSPDYEDPADRNRDNIYEVVIRATDTEKALTADQYLTVEVLNADETIINDGEIGNPSDGTTSSEEEEDAQQKDFKANLVKNIRAGSLSSNPNEITQLQNLLLLAANNGTKGNELWISEGSKQSTSLFADIHKGSRSSDPNSFTEYSDQIYFSANDGKKGQELWVSNGKKTGTKLASDINNGASGSFPSDLLVVDQRLFFGANDGKHGRELWSYSTKDQSSSLVLDIQTKANIGSNPGELTNFNGQIIFAADDQIYGRELWISDGTGSGTRLVDDINPGGLSSNPSNLSMLNEKLYFIADNNYLFEGRQIFRLENQNTGATAIPIDDVNNTGIEPNSLHSSRDQLFFSAETSFEPTPEPSPSAPSTDKSSGSETPDAEDNNKLGRELWVSNGEADGHQLLKDIAPGAGSSNPRGFHTVGSKTYFSADDGVNGEELWVTDGTESGTYLVSDINKGSGDSSPRSINDLDGKIYFSAKTDQYGRELWRLDDTQKKASRIVSSGAGKKKLRALDGNANEFRFELEGQFGKRQADRITGFDQTEGDQLALGRDVFDGLTDIDLVTVTSKTQLATQSGSSTALIYFEPRGQLYFNQNGDESGYGEDGGLFAILKGGPELSESAFRIL